MKHLKFAFLFLFFGRIDGYSQFPIYQYGEPVTIVKMPVDTFPAPTKFKDTLEANKTKIKDYEGAIIQVGMEIYFRSKTSWVRLIPSSGSGKVGRFMTEEEKEYRKGLFSTNSIGVFNKTTSLIRINCNCCCCHNNNH